MVGKAKKNHLSSNLLLLPAPMKDFASCFSEHSIRVADVSCSGSAASSVAGVRNRSSSILSQNNRQSIQSSVTGTYRSQLSTGKELLIRVTWSRPATAGAGSSISVGVDPIPCRETSCHLLRKKKGSRTFTAGDGDDTIVALFWDITSARYAFGPEPVSDFFIVIVVESEFALLLGDCIGECVKKFEGTIKSAEFKMVSRREQVVGHSLHTTKARFKEGGAEHEITIRCGRNGEDLDEDEGGGEEALQVSVDRKRVVQVRRLRWNFRGNQTIFVDGAPVDMMWDLHSWFSNGNGNGNGNGHGNGNGGGYAMFLFRARSALESRLWLEEEESLSKAHAHGGGAAFSLLVQSFKTLSLS